MSKKSFLTNRPFLSNSKTKTLLTISFFLPNFIIEALVVFLSIYIQMSLSKVLLVEGGPNKIKISFLFDFVNVKSCCFLSKKCIP